MLGWKPDRLSVTHVKHLFHSAIVSGGLHLTALLAYIVMGDDVWAWGILRLFLSPGEWGVRMLLGVGHDFVFVIALFVLNACIYWCSILVVLLLYSKALGRR